MYKTYDLIDNLDSLFASSIAQTYSFTSEQTEDEIIVTGTVPGYSKSDISLEIKGKDLVIEGTAKENQKDFRKVYKLSEKLDVENITASCSNGILTVIIPRIISEVFHKTIKVK